MRQLNELLVVTNVKHCQANNRARSRCCGRAWTGPRTRATGAPLTQARLTPCAPTLDTISQFSSHPLSSNPCTPFWTSYRTSPATPSATAPVKYHWIGGGARRIAATSDLISWYCATLQATGGCLPLATGAAARRGIMGMPLAEPVSQH